MSDPAAFAVAGVEEQEGGEPRPRARLVFNLDPGEGVAWDFMIETALRLRRVLKDEGPGAVAEADQGKGTALVCPA